MSAAREDPIWQMVAILNGSVEGSELVTVLSAFVDESGTGDEPNVVLAAVVSHVNGWIGFNREWAELLAASGLEYAHFTDMRRSRDQYEGWSINKKERFSRQCMAVMKRHCLFGFTVSLNKKLHAEKYRDPCKAEKLNPDSAYALCARHLFGVAIRMAERHLDYTSPINFIFEAGHRNSPNAAAVFNDIKEHSEVSDRLGFFALEDKKKLKPLQAADQIAHQGRRNEEQALREGSFKTVKDATYDGSFVSVQDGLCPFFYFAIGEEHLDFYCDQAKVLRTIKATKKRQRSLDC